ncbi:hypothetical protein LX77_02159 [Gelidibacter algens]|uniref:Uncharacterized protein n=1 Tax=Gelidibacter algens TaxID=49280 RepID=A0A327S1K8_9FLAO|nr:hypothetical protein LX77_02159 [Gelidibacter algens]
MFYKVKSYKVLKNKPAGFWINPICLKWLRSDFVITPKTIINPVNIKKKKMINTNFFYVYFRPNPLLVRVSCFLYPTT